jgi:hypothetical protein
VRIGQLVHDGTWNPRPTALKRLAWEVEKRTSVEMRPDAAEVRLGDAEMRRHPLLYLAGEGAFAPPRDQDAARLRRHIDLGGMLILDSADGRAGGPFDRSARALVDALFPGEGLRRLEDDHVVFKSFYLLDTAPGRVAAGPLEALSREGRACVVYSPNDLGGAWARDAFGEWEHEVVPGGEGQRERAFRTGINLVLYALCLDYKSDQVHIPWILKRRQWRTQ